MIKINNVEMPSPISFTPMMMDITKAERNSQGKMFIEIIATKYKLDLVWGILTQSEMTMLLNALNPVSFNVTFLDPVTGADKTVACYKGDRTIPIASFVDGTAHWKDFKVNLIEL